MSAAENKGLPPDLLAAGKAVSAYVKIAEHIKNSLYPENEAPSGLLPALVTALAVNHSATLAADSVFKALESLETGLGASADGLNEVLEKVESTLNDLPERLDVDSVLLERLAGIEQELFRTANYIGGKVAKS
jgi:hypothetical protein